MNTQKEKDGVCPLDKTKPSPKKLKKVNYLPLPCIGKWIKYRRDLVVPFTLNPADKSRLTPFSKNWGDLYPTDKVSRIKKYFMKYDESCLEDYFICFEFSDKGRFHAHGMIKIKEGEKYNYFHFIETIRKNFGAKKNKKSCFKGETFNSQKDTAFNKNFNYVTKDINHIYRSEWKIKYLSKNTIVKALQRVVNLKNRCKLLNEI